MAIANVIAGWRDARANTNTRAKEARGTEGRRKDSRLEHLAFAQARLANNENVWVAAYGQLVLFVTMLLVAAKERQGQRHFDNLSRAEVIGRI